MSVQACAAPLPLLAKQHTPNNSKIYIASLSPRGEIGPVTVATTKQGYVNQPAFTADGLYFTWRPDGSQADIWFRDLQGHEHAVTCTSEEEYVPSPTPDHRLSIIHVASDLTRQLVILGLDGKPQQTLFPGENTVGAYRWADDHTIAIFVSDPDGSSRLVLGDVSTGKLDTVARQVGAALAPIPNTHMISYVDNSDEHHATLRSMELATHATAKLVELPDGVDNVAWLADGTMLAGSGTKILRASEQAPAWSQVADLHLDGPITRLVVSDDRTRIAIVVHTN